MAPGPMALRVGRGQHDRLDHAAGGPASELARVDDVVTKAPAPRVDAARLRKVAAADRAIQVWEATETRPGARTGRRPPCPMVAANSQDPVAGEDGVVGVIGGRAFRISRVRGTGVSSARFPSRALPRRLPLKGEEPAGDCFDHVG